MLAELAQQLGWLGAALRASPDPNYIAYAATRLTVIESPSLQFAFSYVLDSGNGLTDFQTDTSDPIMSNGMCWKGMFRNAIVACGFPIRSRPECEPGLEVPLPMMISLAAAPRLTIFGGQTILKGFSSLLALVREKSQTALWHFGCNKDRTRIPFTWAETYQDESVSQHLTLQELQNRRHFVGWTDSVIRLAGMIHSATAQEDDR